MLDYICALICREAYGIIWNLCFPLYMRHIWRRIYGSLLTPAREGAQEHVKHTSRDPAGCTCNFETMNACCTCACARLLSDTHDASTQCTHALESSTSMARTVSGELLGSTAGVIFGPGRTLLHTETTIELSRQQSCEAMLRTSSLLGD